MIPTLETERLTLRAPRPSDLAPYTAFLATEESRFVGGPLDAEHAWRSMAISIGCWGLRGFGEFAVEEKSSGAFVGMVGPWYPRGWPEAEIAWIILPQFQRRGYGAEAASRTLAYAYEELGWQTAISCIDAENTASIRLAESLGATCEGEAEFKPIGMLPVYRHLPPRQFFERNGGRLQ